MLALFLRRRYLHAASFSCITTIIVPTRPSFQNDAWSFAANRRQWMSRQRKLCLTPEEEHDRSLITSKFKSLGFEDRDMLCLPPSALLSFWDNVQLLLDHGFSSHQVLYIAQRNPRSFLQKCSFDRLALTLQFLKTIDIQSDKAVRFFANVRTSSCKLDTLKSRVQFVETLIEPKELNHFISKAPGVLSASIDNMKNVVATLQAFGFDASSLRTLFTRNPVLLNLHPERSLNPKLVFLTRFEQSERINREFIVKLLLLSPRFFHTVTESLTSKMEFFVHQGFEEWSKNLLKTLIVLAQLSCTTIQTRFALLKSMGFTQEQLILMVTRLPNIVGLKEDTLQRRIDYFINDLKYDHEKLVQNAGCLGYSMEKRINPRVDMLRSKGILGQVNLFSALKHTDAQFNERFMDSASIGMRRIKKQCTAKLKQE